MNDIAERLTKVERDQSHPNLKPRDAATLILVDRSGRNRRFCSVSATRASSSWPASSCSPAGAWSRATGKMPVASDSTRTPARG